MTIQIYVKFKQLNNWDSQLVCSIIIILIMHYVEKVCIVVLQDNGLVPYS
jgi:t-SNARE complex subunit (syntaxin)